MSQDVVNSREANSGNISRANNGNDNNRERRIDATRYQLSAERETTRSGPGRVGPSKRQLSQFLRRGTLHTGFHVFEGFPVYVLGAVGQALDIEPGIEPGAVVRVHMQISTSSAAVWSSMTSGQRLERGIPRLVAASRGLFLQSRVWGESFGSPRVGVWENEQGVRGTRGDWAILIVTGLGLGSGGSVVRVLWKISSRRSPFFMTRVSRRSRLRPDHLNVSPSLGRPQSRRRWSSRPNKSAGIQEIDDRASLINTPIVAVTSLGKRPYPRESSRFPPSTFHHSESQSKVQRLFSRPTNVPTKDVRSEIMNNTGICDDDLPQLIV